MQRNIGRLEKWADENCMNSTMAIARSCTGLSRLAGDWLGSCSAAKDLGVLVVQDLVQQAKRELAVWLGSEEGLQYTKLYQQQLSQ